MDDVQHSDGDTRPVIVVRDVCNTFRIWASPAQRLIAPALHRSGSSLAPIAPALAGRLQQAAQKRLHVHEALHGISFTLHRGQAMGIIGLNGSGKSTLLQIIAGVLPATSGTVHTHGRVAALLELGSGFNPELTGRENIYINGAILGLATARIDALLGAIIAFADIGDYIDQPVKTYSSGMAVRLAFSVQVHVDPDILIVDEALAVGDAAFQAKAMTRIQEILARGTSLLFVGHDLNAVRTFCQHALLLEQGQMAMLGSPQDVIEEYLYRVHLKAQAQTLPPPVRTPEGFRSADGGVRTLAFAEGGSHLALRYGDSITVCAELELDPALTDAACIVDILDEHGVPLSGRRIRLPTRAPQQRQVNIHIRFQAQLAHGIYRIRARLVQAPDLHQHHRRVLCRHEADLSFEVIDNSIEHFNGLFPLPAEVNVQVLATGDPHDPARA